MSLIEKQNNTLKEVQCLLKDIESELHFRSPHSSKLIDIRDMLEWLEGGRLVGYFEALYGEGEGNTECAGYQQKRRYLGVSYRMHLESA